MTHARSFTLLLALLSATLGYSVTVSMIAFPARCGLDVGGARGVPSNGIPPYTYLWNNGATTQTINGLVPGTYSVTVTDAIGGVAEGSTTVVALFELDVANSFSQLQRDCDLGCTGRVEVNESALSGTAPYSYSNAPQWLPTFFGYEYVCSGTANVISITDQNGCPGELDLGGLIGNVTNSFVQVDGITGACAGDANGTISVMLVGGQGESYVRMWSEATQLEQFYYPPINTPYVITGLTAGNYSISSWVNGSDGQPMCTNPFGAFTVPELPGPCGTISGRVFNDADQNCIQDPDEPGLPYRILTVQPGPRYGMTDAQGDYFIGMPFGSYTLAQPLVDEAQLCPIAVPVPFTVNGGTPSLTIDLADSSFVPHDVEVLLYSTAFRPGFPFTVWGSVRNNTAYPSGTVSLSLNYPTLLDPVTTSAGGTASGGTGLWDLAVVPAYGQQGFGISGTLPPDILLLGEVLVITANATNSIGEASVANNTKVLTRTITGSYDPNDKIGTTNVTGSNEQFFLDADTWIDYTVRFQNTGTDTAFTVVIRDELEVDLDIQSLEILAASHAFVPSFGEGRELVFTFANILLPDSTTDLLGSQGFIAFRMKPRSGLLPGNVIENTAEIYFDFNEPIITNTTEHVVEVSTMVYTFGTDKVTLFPNPTRDGLEIRGLYHDLLYVELVSMEGRVVRSFQVGPGERRLALAGTPAGAYITELTLSGGRSIRLPLIIEHD